MLRKLLKSSSFWLVFKLILAAVFLRFLAQRWEEFDFTLVQSIWSNTTLSELWIAIVLFTILFAVNWASDTYLWWMVVRNKINIPFKEALRINVISHAVGLATPANLGEYGIKALHFTKLGKARQSVLLTLSYRSAKWYVKMAAGLLAGIWVWHNTESMYAWICGGAIVGLIISYPFVPHILDRLYHSSLGRLVFDDKEVRDWNFKDIYFIRALLPAAIKFASYTAQLAILLHLGSNLSFIELFWRSNAIYSLSSVIPTLSLFDPMVKIGIGEIVTHSTGLSLAWLAVCTTIVWSANLGLPSLVGYFLWMKKKD